MAVLPIVRHGHPALRTPAAAVDPATVAGEEFQAFLDDMAETMQEANGVGLAAPQVAVDQQVLAYLAVGAEGDAEEPECRLLVNPMIEPVAGELVYDWEGCLSIPDLRGLVPRHRRFGSTP